MTLRQKWEVRRISLLKVLLEQFGPWNVDIWPTSVYNLKQNTWYNRAPFPSILFWNNTSRKSAFLTKRESWPPFFEKCYLSLELQNNAIFEGINLCTIFSISTYVYLSDQYYLGYPSDCWEIYYIHLYLFNITPRIGPEADTPVDDGDGSINVGNEDNNEGILTVCVNQYQCLA